ncbi:MAG: DUF2797 domain-containing protein [Pseudomonadales bacterium]|nr:DUF2797 domain-containing protein [Pseudomonadales bacterium]
MRGDLGKMGVVHNDPVDYYLRLGDEEEHLNPWIGRRLRLQFHHQITCLHCGRVTRKSYSQGHCYPCFKKLAQCDLCVVSPERCHYFEGTCREPDWGERFCMQPHVVYLANSSGVKVGITRPEQVPTRWIDQGAVQALPVVAVDTRQQSGFVEAAFRQHLPDTTQWQRMLKVDDPYIDMEAERDRWLGELEADLDALRGRFGTQAIRPMQDSAPQMIRYPVKQYPTKVVSLNLDKTPEIEGTLLGIKGQYLIFDIGVINLRKFTSYDVELSS